MGLSRCGSRVYSTSSAVVVNGLSCSTACGIFPDQGWNLCLLHWQVIVPPEPPGKPRHLVLRIGSVRVGLAGAEVLRLGPSLADCFSGALKLLCFFNCLFYFLATQTMAP